MKYSIKRYEEIKKSIRFKKYSHDVDFNMDRNGWILMFHSEKDAEQTLFEQVENYVKWLNKDGDYCYRTVRDGWGLPWYKIYKRGTDD